MKSWRRIAYSLSGIILGGAVLYLTTLPGNAGPRDEFVEREVRNENQHISEMRDGKREQRSRGASKTSTSSKETKQKNDHPDPKPTVTNEPRDSHSNGSAVSPLTQDVSPESEVPETTISRQESTDDIDASYEMQVALEIHRLTNEVRVQQELTPLIYDTELAAIAGKHTADMMERDYFDHVSPDGCDMKCRLDAARYDAVMWAENIAWRTDSNMPDAVALAGHFFNDWLTSDAHAVNITSADMTHEGVGVVRSGDTVYVTVDFALLE